MTRTTCVALLVALALGAVAFVALSADAQEDAGLLLARTCVSERGWRTSTHDCAAIYEVAAWRAETDGTSLASAIRRISPHLHGGTIERRRWLLDLDRDEHRPEGLPVPWERVLSSGRSRREAWAATLVEADALVTGRVPRVCSDVPRTWGSTEDVRRIRLAGERFEATDCGATVNLFGRRFRRSR